jgi:hypothetical protein|tara:strand:+ start:7280 stop:7585 length:306 start_codon:yes stop_codon:yes gene_type:complete
MKIVWNDTKTIGIAVNFPEENDENGVAYELRKGSSNTLGLIDEHFMEAWSEMTAFHNCEIVDIPESGELKVVETCRACGAPEKGCFCNHEKKNRKQKGLKA